MKANVEAVTFDTGSRVLRVDTFPGEGNAFLNVRLDGGYAVVHITVDPLDPDGLVVYLYGDVRKGD